MLGLAPDGRTRWRRFVGDESSGAPQHRAELAVDASGSTYLAVRSPGGVQLTKYSPRGEPAWSRPIDASLGIRLRAGEVRVAIAVEQPLGWQISTLSADGAAGGSAELCGSGVEALGVASDAIFVAGWFSDRADFGPAGRARSRCVVREEWPQGDPHVPRDVKQCAQEGYVARIPLSRLAGDGRRQAGSRCVSPGG